MTKIMDAETIPKNPLAWGVPLRDILGEGSVRLDAEHYDPLVRANLETLNASGYELVPLAELAEINLPGKFARIWALDGENGTPYLNATDLMSLGAVGTPAQERFLSSCSDVNLEALLIKEGTILVTCSGTIGRVFLVPSNLAGWAGTHDLIRVVPHDEDFAGFLFAYLQSPLAQIQLLSHTHGGQIDHITDKQLGTCLVPKLHLKTIRAISATVIGAEKLRSESLSKVQNQISAISLKVTNGR